MGVHDYLSGLSRPQQVVYFFRQVVGVAVVSKEVLSRRTGDYQNWVQSFARKHPTPIEWPEKGGRKSDHVFPWLRRMVRKKACGVYFIFKSMEQGPTLLCYNGSLFRSPSVRSAIPVSKSTRPSSPPSISPTNPNGLNQLRYHLPKLNGHRL